VSDNAPNQVARRPALFIGFGTHDLEPILSRLVMRVTDDAKGRVEPSKRLE
jgi:hypothetical protein